MLDKIVIRTLQEEGLICTPYYQHAPFRICDIFIKRPEDNSIHTICIRVHDTGMITIFNFVTRQLATPSTWETITTIKANDPNSLKLLMLYCRSLYSDKSYHE